MFSYTDVDPSAARDAAYELASSPRRERAYMTPQGTRTASPRLDLDVGASQPLADAEESMLSPRGRPQETYPLTALL